MDAFAISIRQPWAWAAVFGQKNIENRSLSVAGQFRKLVGKRIAIQASATLSEVDYAVATNFMRGIRMREPPRIEKLSLGGIIGTVEVGSVVTNSNSPWFEGPAGIVFSNPQRVDFIACRGWPGVFRLSQSGIEVDNFPSLAEALKGTNEQAKASLGL